MSKKRILGAAVMVLSLTVANSYNSYALQVDGGKTQTAEVAQEKQSLAALTKQAEEALAYVKNHKSADYPGVEKYLTRLIAAAKADEVENEAELIRALDEAVAAVPLLTTKDEAVAKRGNEVSAKRTSSRVTTKKTVGTAVKLTVQNDAQKAKTNEPEKKTDDKTEEVELPATGQTETLELGNFVLVGAVVALATIGATLLIVKSKK